MELCEFFRIVSSRYRGKFLWTIQKTFVYVKLLGSLLPWIACQSHMDRITSKNGTSRREINWIFQKIFKSSLSFQEIRVSSKRFIETSENLWMVREVCATPEEYVRGLGSSKKVGENFCHFWDLLVSSKLVSVSVRKVQRTSDKFEGF